MNDMSPTEIGREGQVVQEEKGVSLPVAIGIIAAIMLVLGGVGLAAGYKFFWNQHVGPRVWDAEKARWEFALKKDPKDVEGWTELGYALLNKGDLEGAEKAYRKALQLDPKAVEVNYFIGQIKMKERKFAEAEKLFKKVADIAPANPLPHYELANAYYKQKKYDLAERSLVYIVEKIDPALVEVHHLLGAVREGKKKKKEAIESYKQAVLFDPGFKEARDALHRLGVKDKDLPQMPADVSRPGTITPVKPDAPVPGLSGSGSTQPKEAR